MEGAAVVSPRSSATTPDSNLHTSTLAFDKRFLATPKGILLLAEMVFGLLVWILVGGTEYHHVPALGWVMFVAILYWVLTDCLFIIYLSEAHNRIPKVPWTTLFLCFNGSATVLYLVSAVVDVNIVSQAIRGRHSYNCWAASAFFAFLTTLCYAGSTCISYRAWRRDEEV
ncbi:CKLF-like MARVEL transmembrane domain-containing protein 8b [Lampris incognitus]|uniref:CKLF-like MARVEL transmembrane domain-containing protein 8b n=1 Tax=Lampris incognitus TaxID=2546036 RepID=UPI0024B5B36E|nr:CKLF-like MARVEL transmembrane domain-containing protein 8b [Lampris incognitus]